MAWNECAASICSALHSSEVLEVLTVKLQQNLRACIHIRIALAGVAVGYILLTNDLKQAGALTYSVIEATHSCCGRVIQTGLPCLRNTQRPKCDMYRDISLLMDFQPTSSATGPRGFFCLPIAFPHHALPAGAALLAEFREEDMQSPDALKPCLLLANELSQHFSKELESVACRISQALLPPEHDPGWGLDFHTSHSAPGSADESGEDTEGGEDLQDNDSLGASSETGTEGGLDVGLSMLGRERHVRPEVLRLLHSMSYWSLRFQDPLADAAYSAWRHRQLVERDTMRLLGLLLCQLIYIAPVSQHSLASGKVPSLLLLLLLWLRLRGGSSPGPSPSWYSTHRTWLVAAAYLATNLDWSWEVPSLLGALPNDTCRERALKIVLIWMLGTGTAFQVDFPWHAAMLLAAWVTWLPAGWRLCGVMRPLDWLPGCALVTAMKMLLCACVLPLLAVYFSELKGRQLWARAVWQGHPHVQ